MSIYYKGSLEPLGTFLPVGIETLGYLLPQPGVHAWMVRQFANSIFPENKSMVTNFITLNLTDMLKSLHFV